MIVPGKIRSPLNRCITNPYHLEFNTVGADKAAGVAAVASFHGINAEHVIAFGDGNNDVRMLCLAGLGVAMHEGRSQRWRQK